MLETHAKNRIGRNVCVYACSSKFKLLLKNNVFFWSEEQAVHG